MRRALVLGTHSFVDGGSKVGVQHLAQGLARHGWQVDYVATASSLFDIYGRQRHARLRRVWLQGQDRTGEQIEPGLTEYAFKALFPAHRSVLRARWQLKTYAWLMPAWLKARHYDLCMHESSPNVVYFPHCKANARVFRLADWPDGFAHDLHPVFLEQFPRLIASAAYDEIWAVSQPLADYALGINSNSHVITMPNGVEHIFAPRAVPAARQPKSAIFLGGLSAWADMDLLHAAAVLLPDWTFDVYGPGAAPRGPRPANVRYHASVPRQSVPALLAGYEVGLIPLKESNGRMRYVERPLKFYEYIGAGLGVASTDIGSLRHGMGELASYGNTPAAFAQAIQAARQLGAIRTDEVNRRFLEENDWQAVVSRALDRIDSLLRRKE